MGAGAVQLAWPDDVLGIAEGIETALSAAQLFGIPTWACLGASRMATVKIPDSVKTVRIFADNDEAGRRPPTPRPRNSTSKVAMSISTSLPRGSAIGTMS